MSKQCSICNSRDRAQIEESILRGEPIARIAREYGRPESNLRRHREHLAQAVELVQHDHGSSLKAEIEELKAELTRIQAEGRTGGDWKKEMAALDRRLRLLELQARTSGESDRGSCTNIVNINLDPKTAEKMAAAFLARQKLLRAGHVS